MIKQARVQKFCNNFNNCRKKKKRIYGFLIDSLAMLNSNCNKMHIIYYYCKRRFFFAIVIPESVYQLISPFYYLSL